MKCTVFGGNVESLQCAGAGRERGAPCQVMGDVAETVSQPAAPGHVCMRLNVASSEKLACHQICVCVKTRP